LSLFNQSTKPVSAAVVEVADSAGASADAEMLNRSLRSLEAAFQHFNTRANWDFLINEAPVSAIIAPFLVTGTSASGGQTSAAMPTGHGFLPDDIIGLDGLPPGIRVTATGASGVGFTMPYSTTAAGINIITAVGNRDSYALPADFRNPYSVRLYGVMSTLRPLRRRQYDRSIVSEFTNSTPVAYDITYIAPHGKIRLTPPPGAPDVMQVRYYRRMTMPSATADATNLDILQDYEPYLIAWAKWHFLMDKSEGRGDQAATWLSFAQDGIKQMIADQTRVPDEDLMFIPGAYSYNPAFGPNSVRGTLDNYWG
jgi:hypothetical protein